VFSHETGTRHDKRKVPTLDAVELRARREALGLDEAGLADALHWKATSVLACEGAARTVPGWVASSIDLLEMARDAMAGALEDSLPADLRTYSNDAMFWAEWPEFAGIPAAVHRVAAADALRSGKWAGIDARIVSAEPRHPKR
jgi:hypothetical protein